MIPVDRQLLMAGCRKFSEQSPLLLITPAMFALLPDRFVLSHARTGDLVTVGFDRFDPTITHGMLGYGVALAQHQIALATIIIPDFQAQLDAEAVTLTAQQVQAERVLVRFHAEFGRMGELDGLFVCARPVFETMWGVDCQFGEVLGKHSDISCVLGRGNLTIVSTEQDKIAWLVNVCGDVRSSRPYTTISGTNPLDYME